MKVLAESTLTSKEQLTVPRAVRRLLGLQTGDSLVWGLDDQGRVVVEAGRQHTLADVRAAVAAAGPAKPSRRVSVEEMKAGVAARMRRKYARH